jgi:hypothetical protein
MGGEDWCPVAFRCTASVAAASGTVAGSTSRCGRGNSTVHHWAPARLNGCSAWCCLRERVPDWRGVWLRWVSEGV